MLDNTFTAFFLDSSSAPGSPLTGLSATISIVDVESGTVVVNNVAMTEVGLGFYKYVYSGYQPTRSYNWVCNPNSSSAYLISGTTALPEGPARGGGGGTTQGISQQHLTSLKTSLENRLSEIYRELTKEAEKPEKEIDFTPILDKIESIETSEVKLEEKELKKALKIIEKLDKNFTEYVSKEMSEKDELNAITREFTRIEMEEQAKHKEHMMKMMQEEEDKKKKEEEDDMKELELIKAEFEKQDQMEKEEKRKELEAELKEMEKEMKEKKKELKKL